MINVRRAVLIGAAGVAGFALPGTISSAQTPESYPALEMLQPGQWELREAGSASLRSLCIGDPKLLLQVRHGTAACTRFTIANDARMATVAYSCPGAGNGRTTVRAETSRLVQIETQGVADKSPFVLQFEGRRVGACSAPAPSVFRAPTASPRNPAIRLGIR
jgi:hypothetical protein